MSLKCHVCNTPYTLQKGVYVCEEGHIFHHTEEVCDNYTGFTGKKAKKKNEGKGENVKDFNHQLLLLFSKLYFEMKTVLNIKQDTAFKTYLSYLQKDKFYYYNFTFLFSILYYQKRAENENENKTLFFKDFLQDFDFCFYQHKYVTFLNELKIQRLHKRRGTTMASNHVRPHLIENYLKFLGEETYKDRKFIYFTRDEDYKNELKKVFRLNTRRDDDILNMYLDRMLKTLHLEKSEELIVHFKRFCNFYCTDDRVFVPERFIYSFLYIFVRNYEIELDYKRIETELCYAEEPDSAFTDQMLRYKDILSNEKRYIELLKMEKNQR